MYIYIIIYIFNIHQSGLHVFFPIWGRINLVQVSSNSTGLWRDVYRGERGERNHGRGQSDPSKCLGIWDDLGKPWWGTRPEHGTPKWPNPSGKSSSWPIFRVCYFLGCVVDQPSNWGCFACKKNGFSHSAIKNWDLLTIKVYGKWVNQLKGKLTELDSWPCGWGFFVTCINIISLALGNGTRVRRELSISQVVSSQPWKFTHVWMIYLLYCHFPVIVPWRNMDDVKPWWIWPWR